MAKYARLDADGRVIEIFEHDEITPDMVHVPELAAQFELVPDNVTPNSVKKGKGKWDIAPVASGEPVRLITAVELRACMTLADKIKWDNPDTVDPEKRPVIITAKAELSHGALDPAAAETKELLQALVDAGIGSVAGLLK
jgi:hypothetical protein